MPVGLMSFPIIMQCRTFQIFWDNLPADPILVSNPMMLSVARLFLLRKLSPEIVDLILIVTHDLKRNGLVELVLWSAIQSCERLPIYLKGDNHNGTRFVFVELFSGFTVTLYMIDFAVFEDRSVESGGFFGLAIEPETRGDLRGHIFGVFWLFLNVTVWDNWYKKRC